MEQFDCFPARLTPASLGLRPAGGATAADDILKQPRSACNF